MLDQRYCTRGAFAGGTVLDMVKLKELVVILELHNQGLNISAIAQRTGMDRKTVRKYVLGGLQVPRGKTRIKRLKVMQPFERYVRERLMQWPELSCTRLFREIKQMGYAGQLTALKDFVRTIRPKAIAPYEDRFETAPGQQAQVDFAQFRTVFTDNADRTQTIWLFSMVLGHSRYLWGQFEPTQDLTTVVRCHELAFEHFGGTPRQILYDRMKTAVLGDHLDGKHIVYNDKLLALAKHYGFEPKACRAYRAKTKGKVERPFRYVRADFFMGRSFANLADLNRQWRHWLDSVAHQRVHGTTDQVVNEHFAQERQALQSLPVARIDLVLQLHRRASRDGFVSVEGNYYSVPNGARAEYFEVQMTAHHVRILQGQLCVATHPLLTGHHERSLLPGHRAKVLAKQPLPEAAGVWPMTMAGHRIVPRDLETYASIGAQLSKAASSTVKGQLPRTSV